MDDLKDKIRDWLREVGIEGEIRIAHIQPGMGSTDLWKISHCPGHPDLVLRMYGADKHQAANREAVAMKTAVAHGLPVPDIVGEGEIADRPTLLMAFAEGEIATELVAAHPGRAFDIGDKLGTSLGKVNRVPAPAMPTPMNRWIALGGPALEPLHEQLNELPRADRLLHLDFHPNNVLMDRGEVTAIVDWENALPGPPHVDLARTKALLHAVKIAEMVPSSTLTALGRLEAGLVAGYTSVIGPDSHPELSMAWGMAMTVEDVKSHVGKPGSWVTHELVDRLRETRDVAIKAATA